MAYQSRIPVDQDYVQAVKVECRWVSKCSKRQTGRLYCKSTN